MGEGQSNAEELVMKLRVRQADIPPAERDLFERYGERVISGILTGGYTPTATDLLPLYERDDVKVHAHDWLSERDRLRERHETLTFCLEVGILFFVILGVVFDAFLVLRH